MSEDLSGGIDAVVDGVRELGREEFRRGPPCILQARGEPLAWTAMHRQDQLGRGIRPELVMDHPITPDGGKHPALPTTARRHGVARALVVGAAALVILLGSSASYPQTAQTHPGTPAIIPVTRYVATNGSDAAIGGLDAPLRTIQRAVDLTGPGDTIVIRGGEYQGFDIATQGTADAPVTLRAFAGEEPVIEGEPERPDVIRVRSRARHVVIEGLTVRGSVGSRGSGILITNVEEGPIVVKGCRFYDHAGFGVNIFWSRNITIAGNDISRNGTGVHVVGEGGGVVIEDNDIHENNRMIRNTPRDVDAHDDYGAVGVTSGALKARFWCIGIAFGATVQRPMTTGGTAAPLVSTALRV